MKKPKLFLELDEEDEIFSNANNGILSLNSKGVPITHRVKEKNFLNSNHTKLLTK
jgi:hypothetical protein